MALTTVSSLSEMYSGSAPTATNDVVMKSIEKALDAGGSGVDPTMTKGGEGTRERSEEVEGQ